MTESIWLLMGVAAAVGVVTFLRIVGQEWAAREGRTRAHAEIRAEQNRVPVVAAETGPPTVTPGELLDNSLTAVPTDSTSTADSPTSVTPKGPNGSPSR